MGPGEVGYVLAIAIFLGHTHVEDETCPLRVWHQRLFQDYCSLRTLSAAVMKLMETRGYTLRIGDKQLRKRHFALLRAATSWAPDMTRAVAPMLTPMLRGQVDRCAVEHSAVYSPANCESNLHF